MNTARSVAFCFAAMILTGACQLSFGQTFSQAQGGQPLIYLGVGDTVTTDPKNTNVDVVVATLGQPTSYDICYRIYEIWSNNGQTINATIDARGFLPLTQGGTVPCSQNPIPSDARGRLLLGNQIISTKAPWVIPSGVEVAGLGSSTSSSAPTNTTIIADSAFVPDSTGSVIELGVSGASMTLDAKLRDLTVDCGTSSQCAVGVMNISGNDNARVENVVINNARVAGLAVVISSGPGGAQNSGTYRNITVQYPNCGSCSSTTTGIQFVGSDIGTLVRGLEDVKVTALTPTGCPSNSPYGIGIDIKSAATRIANASVDCFSTGLQLELSAAASTAHNVQIDNFFYLCTFSDSDCQNGNNGVGVSIADGSSNVSLSNITGTSLGGVTVKNLVHYSDTAPALTTISQGFFALGDPEPQGSETCPQGFTCQTLLSSDPNVQWMVPGLVGHP